MSPAITPAPLPREKLKQWLRPHLFPDVDGLQTFAVLDGASVPDLLDQLYGEMKPEFVCLYRGQLEPDIAEVAPYLVRLERDAPFTDWLLTQGWGNHWGIFACSQANLKAVRTHFRRFLMVRDPEGDQIYFRFYDPRVLPIFLPTCNAEELKVLFGPLTMYACEAEKGHGLGAYRMEGEQLRAKVIPLTVPEKS